MARAPQTARHQQDVNRHRVHGFRKARLLPVHGLSQGTDQLVFWLQRQSNADAAPGIVHGRCHSGELRRSVRRAPTVPIATL
jgi:hypothetical protein